MQCRNVLSLPLLEHEQAAPFLQSATGQENLFKVDRRKREFDLRDRQWWKLGMLLDQEMELHRLVVG